MRYEDGQRVFSRLNNKIEMKKKVNETKVRAIAVVQLYVRCAYYNTIEEFTRNILI